MNGMNEEKETGPGDDQPRDERPVAFCQSCGKPLHRDTVRIVGPAVYCEPCLAARLAGVGSSPGNTTGYAPAPGFPPVSGLPPNDPATQAGWVVPPPVPDQPNPGLAALLGFLPGVGAMYNGQYAKGIVHLIVFAVLISLSHVSGIFGLFIAGWIFYMVIEAHHTAKARRDGTPLPNPFGLNDIGERLGFGRAWASGPGATAPDVVGVAQDAARAASDAFRGASVRGTPPPPFANAPTWGAPVDSYPPPYTAGPASQPPYPQQPYPYSAPFSAPYVASIDPAAQSSRFPTGAVWLIGLGTVFLLSTTGLFHGLFGPALVGFALIGLGVLVFVRRMTDTGSSLVGDGTAAYRLRVLRALRISIWLMLIGVLFLLDVFNLLTWHRSWPILLIVLGVMTLLERTTYSALAAETVGQGAPAYPQGFSPHTQVPTPPTAPHPSDQTSRNESQQGGD